jgi:hypothetical protein
LLHPVNATRLPSNVADSKKVDPHVIGAMNKASGARIAGVGADAQRQRQHRNHGEAGHIDDLTQREAKIMQHAMLVFVEFSSNFQTEAFQRD